MEVTGFVGAVLVCDGDGEVVELTSDLGVIASQDGLSDGQSFAKQVFGIDRIAARETAGGEVAEVDGDFVLVGWVTVADDGQGVLEECCGFVDAVLLEERRAEHGEVFRDEVVVRSECALADSNGTSGQGLCLLGAASGEGESGEVVPEPGRTGMVGAGVGGDEVEGFGVGAGRFVVAARVLVQDAEGVEDNGTYRRFVAVMLGRGGGEGTGEDLLSADEVTLEAAQVPELRERSHPLRAAWCNRVEDAHGSPSRVGGVVELSELSVAHGEDFECCGQLAAVAAGAVEVSGCLFGVSQCVVGAAQRGVANGQPVLVPPPQPRNARRHGPRGVRGCTE